MNEKPYYRFSVFLADETPEGRMIKKQSIGHAYLPEGHATYNLYLYTFQNQPFYIIPSRDDQKKVLVMTREINPQRTKKYLWHKIGEGNILAPQGVMKLTFDLFEAPIYVSLFPDENLRPIQPTKTNPNLKKETL